MYRTIIVPIDPAHLDKGKAMIGIARDLGGKDGKLVLTSVIEDVPTYVAAELPGGLIDKSKEAAKKDLEDLVKETGAAADIDVRAGHAPTAILAVAHENGADLIVVASHKPELKDYLLGSTAAAVVRHAECSVLVMR